MSPLEMFRTAQYSAWDDQGFPTHDAKGVEVGFCLFVSADFSGVLLFIDKSTPEKSLIRVRHI